MSSASSAERSPRASFAATRGTRSTGPASEAGRVGARGVSQEVEKEVEPVDPSAREAADHGAVDADVLEIVARVLLDEPHRACRSERMDAALDERSQMILIAFDES